MSETAPVSRLFIPGGGLRCFEDRPCLPLLRTVLRAEKAAAYYYENPESFRDPRAFIGISGGHKHAFPAGPVKEVSETFYVSGFLANAGVPPELWKGNLEDLATDSAQNLILMVAGRMLRPEEFSPEEPLRCVTSGPHGERMERWARCLGFAIGSFVTLESGEAVDPAESVLLERTEAALNGLAGQERSESFFEELELRRQKLVDELNAPEMLQELASIRSAAGYTFN